MDNPWDGVDRRELHIPSSCGGGGGDDRALMTYIVTQLESVNAKLNAIHIDSVGHKAEMHIIKQDINDIKKAFPKTPDGEVDLDGHHDYHWKLVESSKTWNEIWTDVRKKLFGGIAWAIVVFVAYSIWESIKNEVKK